MGESQSIRFTYSPVADGIFDSIQMLPSSKVKQGETVTFNVSTSDSVTSATVTLSDNRTLPMDRSTAGEFTKGVIMTTEGTIKVGVNLISAGETKSYTDVATVIVERSVTIGKIRLYSDSVDKTKLNVTREVVGTAPKYKVQYGLSETNLDQYTIVTSNEIIVENLTIGETYYFQITPLDENELAIGLSSIVVNTTVGEDLACVVKGITVSDMKIGDKYYLVWTAVQNAETYIIYRSEFETDDTTNMQKVGQTT